MVLQNAFFYTQYEVRAAAIKLLFEYIFDDMIRRTIKPILFTFTLTHSHMVNARNVKTRIKGLVK